MGLLNDASPWLTEMMQAAATDPEVTTVTYVRGAERIDLAGKAWASNTRFGRLPKDGGAVALWMGRDYFIPKSELPFEPAKGDWIEEATAGVTSYFDVLPPPNEPAARDSDDERTIWRVHTKERR